MVNHGFLDGCALALQDAKNVPEAVKITSKMSAISLPRHSEAGGFHRPEESAFAPYPRSGVAWALMLGYEVCLRTAGFQPSRHGARRKK